MPDLVVSNDTEVIAKVQKTVEILKIFIWGTDSNDYVRGPVLETICSAIIEAIDEGLLERIQRAVLRVRLSKCLIGVETLEVIGHHISKGIIEPNEENICKVCNAP